MAAERKLYLGGRVRRLRRELGLNQSAMAERSASRPPTSTISSATSGR